MSEIVVSGGSGAAAQLAPPGEQAAYAQAAEEAFVVGFNDILLIAAIVSFVGATLGFALVRARDFVQAPDGAAEPVPSSTPVAVGGIDRGDHPEEQLHRGVVEPDR
jgi:hypothetical protein